MEDMIDSLARLLTGVAAVIASVAALIKVWPRKRKRKK